MKTKFCRDCKRTLPISAFTMNRREKDGLAFYCKQCARARLTASRRRRFGPPKTRNGQGPETEPGFKWCPECDSIKPKSEFPRAPSQANGVGAYCKPCFNHVIVANRDKNHGSVRNYHLKHRYGITAEYADALLAAQSGLCAICRERPAAHVDHDHLTGRVRGLLCFTCNAGLGNFRDRPDLMLLAVRYLQHDTIEQTLDPYAAPITTAVGLTLVRDDDAGRPDDVSDEEWADLFAEIQSGYDDTDAEPRTA